MLCLPILILFNPLSPALHLGLKGLYQNYSYQCQLWWFYNFKSIWCPFSDHSAHHHLLCSSLMHTLQKATSPIFKILWCVALSLGQHFLWAHALDFPWLDAWLETFDSRILSHHKWKVLAKLCWKCNVIALTKSVNVILKLLDGWLLSLIGLDVFPTSPN